MNTGLKSDFSLLKGFHTLKFGAMVYHTFLDENFALGVTDHSFALSTPTLAPYDLTAGRTQFRFAGHTDIKQEAVYAQDNIALTLLVGGPIDEYDGVSHRSLLQPPLGATYNVKQSNTVLRVGYGKLMLTPYNENLLLSGSTGVGGLQAGGQPTPLKPATRSQYNAGFEQGVGRYLILNAEYFWKYTDRDFDFDALLNSPLAFPIQWQKSKIDGFGIKLTMPEKHGVSAYSVLGHTRARFFSPEVGGILFNQASITTKSEPFRIDHDLAFQQSTNVQYQPPKTLPWFGLTWRYESGAVAGNAPHASTSNVNPATGLQDLTGITPHQQAQILPSCGNFRSTINAPLLSCNPDQLRRRFYVCQSRSPRTTIRTRRVWLRGHCSTWRLDGMKCCTTTGPVSASRPTSA